MNENNIINTYKSTQNFKIINRFIFDKQNRLNEKTFTNYLYNNLEETVRLSEQKGSYFIFLTYILFFIIFITIYIHVTQTFEITLSLFNRVINIPLIILSMPFVFVYYYYRGIYTFDHERKINIYDEFYFNPYDLIYNKRYCYIFLLSCIIQTYIYWILMRCHIYNLFEPISIWDVITITKILSDEEKVMVVHKYLENLHNITQVDLLDKYYDELYILIYTSDFGLILQNDRTYEDVILTVNDMIKKYIKLKLRLPHA